MAGGDHRCRSQPSGLTLSPLCVTGNRESQVLGSQVSPLACHGCTSSLRSMLSESPSSLPKNQETELPQPPSPGLALRLGVLIRQGLDALLGHISQHREGWLHNEVDETCSKGGTQWRVPPHTHTQRAGQRRLCGWNPWLRVRQGDPG